MHPVTISACPGRRRYRLRPDLDTPLGESRIHPDIARALGAVPWGHTRRGHPAYYLQLTLVLGGLGQPLRRHTFRNLAVIAREPAGASGLVLGAPAARDLGAALLGVGPARRLIGIA